MTAILYLFEVPWICPGLYVNLLSYFDFRMMIKLRWSFDQNLNPVGVKEMGWICSRKMCSGLCILLLHNTSISHEIFLEKCWQRSELSCWPGIHEQWNLSPYMCPFVNNKDLCLCKLCSQASWRTLYVLYLCNCLISWTKRQLTV